MDTELAYLAGFFDGEGCVSIGKAKGNHYHLMVYVAQIDPAPLMIYQKRFGGTVIRKFRKTEHRAICVWQASSYDAINVLEAMLPFLVVKASQAQLAFEFQESFKQRATKSESVYETILAERERLYVAMKAQKQTNYDHIDLPKSTKEAKDRTHSGTRLSKGKGTGKKLPQRWEKRNVERYEEVKKLRAEGLSYQAIADRFGVTRGRIAQMVANDQKHNE